MIATILHPISSRLGLLKDRRKAPRTSAARGCSLGEIIEVSATGVRIRCRRFYRPTLGKGVSISMPEGIFGSHVTVTGVVCWVSNATGEWHAGIALDQHNAIRQLVDSPDSTLRADQASEKHAALFRPDWRS